jgi:hypothetical protein
MKIIIKEYINMRGKLMLNFEKSFSIIRSGFRPKYKITQILLMWYA